MKVALVSLPKEMMERRLEKLIPNLMVWSHETKGHFRVKVKGLLERMIRKFGYDAIIQYTPEEDRKLLVNIRKTRERKRRGKEAIEEAVEAETVKVFSCLRPCADNVANSGTIRLRCRPVRK
jgi:ribosomal RNA-processing protein 12